MIPDPIGQALRWLRSGGLLAYPTETVWGLAADAASEESVERLLRWKGRSADEPIAVLVESAEAASLSCSPRRAWRSMAPSSRRSSSALAR